MPALRDDDPNKWKYDLHTQVKHSLLTRYLSAWIKVLGRHGGAVIYVDAFAGRGRYSNGEPGSPLLALDLVQRELGRPGSTLGRVECHFIEANPTNFANLQQELAKHPASSDPRLRVVPHQSTFAGESGAIVARIRGTGWPCFMFLDPFGYDDAPMRLIADVLRLPRVEALINLMYDFASRAIGVQGNPALEATLDGLFGTPTWRSLAGLTGRVREEAFVEIYRQQLKASGARFAVPFPMADDTNYRTLYYLIHATGHPLGAEIMKEVMVGVSSPGRVGYHGQRRHNRAQIGLFGDADALTGYLLDVFAGRTTTFDDIFQETLEETGTCIEKDYRACLKALEADGTVSVVRVTSKRTGLGGLDRVTFPPK